MKKFNSFLLILFTVLGSFTFTACFDDEDEEEELDCSVELQEAADIMQRRSTTFNQNPTAANCNALKQSALDVIEKARKCNDANWEQAAQAWRNVDCSAF
ncbi:hypothetical protein [Rufibacter sp. LB8]|uniref:hypothetical protein n=1 Tax=Rufibacter sp. LB8 TaxID=2777781 RepID=UPI00178C5988|nr:hypothetical protein [Rufibacter sp. LB8]